MLDESAQGIYLLDRCSQSNISIIDLEIAKKICSPIEGSFGNNTEASRTGLGYTACCCWCSRGPITGRCRCGSWPASRLKAITAFDPGTERRINYVRTGQSRKSDRTSKNRIARKVSATNCSPICCLRSVYCSKCRYCRAFVSRAAAGKQIWYRDRGDYANDDDDDEQFDKRKSLLILHCMFFDPPK